MGSSYPAPSTTRGLSKTQLGGVIFGCKQTTINECLCKELFGIPSSHSIYVKKIEPGLPIFLFNYTDRTLLGIFEAVSSGQMNIDPCAWSFDGSHQTPFPAQVRVRTKLQCELLTETQFKPIIIDNYYGPHHFWFELDHPQANSLSSLMASQALSCPRRPIYPHKSAKQTTFFQPGGVNNTLLNNTKSLPVNTRQVNTFDTLTEKDVICMRIKELALKHKPVDPIISTNENYVGPKVVGRATLSAECEDKFVLNNNDVEKKGATNDPMLAKWIETFKGLMAFNAVQKDTIEELKASNVAQKDAIDDLRQKIVFLEKDLAEARAEIKNLKGTCVTSELENCVEINDIQLNEVSLHDDQILLIGGYDGVSWLSSLECYSPSQDLTKSLSPMNTERCFAAVSKLDGELYVFGGKSHGHWFDTVESYNPADDRWTTCPPLNRKNGNLAGVTVKDKVYAVGGGCREDFYSSAEVLDFEVGAWIHARSMLEKRFALAVAELNGALYAVGGYDGTNYLRTAERFDPREHSWKKIESMSTMRGCSAMVVLNEKLYILGGYDGKEMVSTVEIYDPRRGSWVFGEPMNEARGFFGAAVVKDSIHVIGGIKSGNEIKDTNDTVECYKEGRGWEITNSNAGSRRCCFPAIAL